MSVNFTSRRSDSRINYLLAEPRFARADLLRLIETDADGITFRNWVNRGFLDLEFQVCGGDQNEFARISSALKANREAGLHRRYTGGDAIKVSVLASLSSAGVALPLAKPAGRIALERARRLLVTGRPPDRYGVLIVDGRVEPIDAEELPNLNRDHLTFVNIDRIVRRFLEAFDTHA